MHLIWWLIFKFKIILFKNLKLKKENCMCDQKGTNVFSFHGCWRNSQKLRSPLSLYSISFYSQQTKTSYIFRFYYTSVPQRHKMQLCDCIIHECIRCTSLPSRRLPASQRAGPQDTYDIGTNSIRPDPRQALTVSLFTAAAVIHTHRSDVLTTPPSNLTHRYALAAMAHVTYRK